MNGRGEGGEREGRGRGEGEREGEGEGEGKGLFRDTPEWDDGPQPGTSPINISQPCRVA